jgi:hypothetical protein
MPVRLRDVEIARLVAEGKVLPDDYRRRLQVRAKRGHKEQELDLKGVEGSEFRVVLRQSTSNALDFSIILAYRAPKSNQVFRLRRYNGKSHEHTNVIEGEAFYDFHIHVATERYQDLGMREDSFAEVTERFGDYDGAVRALLADCGFQASVRGQQALFGEEIWP